MFFQTDATGLLNGPSPYNMKGHGDVAVSPAQIPANHVARWTSTVERGAANYGEPGTGEWQFLEDHRGDTLYTADGQYELGTDYQEQSFDGLGPLPAWLTMNAPSAPEPTLAEAQAGQLAQINAAFEKAAGALTAGYPEAERLTWPVQQSEALAWAADPAASTSYLDGLATARGITPAEMRQLTLDQVNAFMAASQQLVGTRQRLRDAINVATTVAGVRAVVWPA
ncbi:hypothetical protein [Paracandidimonas lactea]|uniref:hypothetical protein n=1 Tax=Paracandidimonas lactea TaxID=2895524 RepID=UPI001F3CD45C|nr:hypothetical protein [Paracandidimonas lactea]